MKIIWTLILFIHTDYYQVIHLAPHQNLSVQSPTPISMFFAYPTEKECVDALAAMRKHKIVQPTEGRCSKMEIEEGPTK